jgi:hypothetical protein
VTEAQLARALDVPADLSESALAQLAGRSRLASYWMWVRLGGPLAPPGSGALGAHLRDRLARDLVASVRLRKAVEALANAGIEPIVMKGAALAASAYPASWLRSRTDDDLLVPRVSFRMACDVLERSGYTRQPANPDWEDTGQAHLTKVWPGGDRHHIDLHWRAVLPRAFKDLPDYDALRRSARPLPAAGSGAWHPSLAHTMVLACAHRAAHHGPDDDPIWLLDVHFVASRLDPASWKTAVETALASRVAAVCAVELARASSAFGTCVPMEVLQRLGEARGEPTARHLQVRSRLHRVWLDVLSRDDRWRALGARVLPSRAYMKTQYGGPDLLLPVLYLWRATAGAVAWIAEAIAATQSRHDDRSHSTRESS